MASFDRRELRDVLGMFTTGVTVVTACDRNGKRYGLTANSFSSVSLEPPLVSWCQARVSKSFAAFAESDRFAVHVLAEDQVGLAAHFATSVDDKFAAIACDAGLGDLPILRETAAHFECRKVATYPGGDHVIYLGRVDRFRHSGRRPLAFSHGSYAVPYAHDLGPLAIRLAAGAPARPAAVSLASEQLRRISDALERHAICLAVWGNHGPTIIRWQPGIHFSAQALPVGLVVSLTTTATGRAFAAFMPEDVTVAFVREDLRLVRQPGEDAAAQRRAFDDAVRDARTSGIARAESDSPSTLHDVAVAAFSVPVFDERGAMVLSLSLVGPRERLRTHRAASLASGLREAAADLSRAIGRRSDR